MIAERGALVSTGLSAYDTASTGPGLLTFGPGSDRALLRRAGTRPGTSSANMFVLVRVMQGSGLPEPCAHLPILKRAQVGRFGPAASAHARQGGDRVPVGAPQMRDRPASQP